MKLLKLAAISYLIKTLLLAAAWLFIPDLPQRATTVARETWARVWVSQAPATDATAAAATMPVSEKGPISR